jgi:hypothetical protein
MRQESQDTKGYKVGFIREKGKAAQRDGHGARKIGSSLLFTWWGGGGYLLLFCWGGESGVGVEWSFDISLQEHAHGPVYMPCGILRHPQEALTCELYVPLQDVGLTVLSWGMGALAHLVI